MPEDEPLGEPVLYHVTAAPAANVSLQCIEPGCAWVSQELSETLAAQVLGMHVSKLEKIHRPSIKLGVAQDEFDFFSSRWKSYVRNCAITDPVILRDQLIECCDHELMKHLHNTLGSTLLVKSAADIMKEIEKLAVIRQSNLVKVSRLLEAVQDRDEPVRSYVARLKQLAGVCRLAVWLR